MNRIYLRNFTELENEILLLLEEKEKVLYGDIFKELNLSQIKGAELILSLKAKGHISQVNQTSYYQLNGSLVK